MSDTTQHDTTRNRGQRVQKEEGEDQEGEEQREEAGGPNREGTKQHSVFNCGLRFGSCINCHRGGVELVV